jgi:site-specific recombinase XerD
VRRIGVRLGNWLTPEQGRRLLESAAPSSARDLRDHAMVPMLIGCGLRRAELLALSVESIQQREEHWVIADLVGKGGHVRTRAINKAGRVWGHPRCCGMLSALRRLVPRSTSWLRTWELQRHQDSEAR